MWDSVSDLLDGDTSCSAILKGVGIDKQVTVDTPEGPKTKVTPCSPGAAGAIEKTWTDINSEDLLEPLLSIRDFEKAIQVNRPTVSQADIQKHIAFTNESGGDGA